jgi:hypothetical protein
MGHTLHPQAHGNYRTNAFCLHLLPADAATIQYAKEYYYEENVVPKQVPVGEAMVYDGTFTVSGGSPALKWKEGRFQYSWIGTTTTKNLEDTLDYPRLGDGVYKLEFVGGSKGRY